MSQKMFYIQCKDHYAFDFILWWGKDSSGYTYNLEKAGLYTDEEAKRICANREIDVAWAEEDVKKHISSAVSIEHLRKDNIKPIYQRPPAPYKKPKKPPALRCDECGKFFAGDTPYDEVCNRCYHDKNVRYTRGLE